MGYSANTGEYCCMKNGYKMVTNISIGEKQRLPESTNPISEIRVRLPWNSIKTTRVSTNAIS